MLEQRPSEHVPSAPRASPGSSRALAVASTLEHIDRVLVESYGALVSLDLTILGTTCTCLHPIGVVRALHALSIDSACPRGQPILAETC